MVSHDSLGAANLDIFHLEAIEIFKLVSSDAEERVSSQDH